jgi:hypothetical protein
MGKADSEEDLWLILYAYNGKRIRLQNNEHIPTIQTGGNW